MLSKFREWASVRFATVSYEKNYIPDPNYSEKDQERRGGRARELRDRSVQLHLDELEENYLCCICTASGEARESDEHIYDTFSTINIPSTEEICTALRDRQHALGSRSWEGKAVSSLPSSLELQEKHSSGEDLESLTNKVSPFEVEYMMYKIRHAVLNSEDRIKRQAVAIHRDKGLMMIEEEEVDTFSRLFRRPVKGYLCETCYDSAKTRLELLQQQIEAILFKADHPFLRRTSQHELQLLYASGQLSKKVLEEILLLRKTNTSTDAGIISEDRNVCSKSPSTSSGKTFSFFASELGNVLTFDVEKKASLADSSICTLRTLVQCGVCENRPCRFFIRPSVLFLCQVCCARDRFYRDNCICINDEALPLDVAHLLTTLSKHYERVHQQDSVHELPQGQLRTAPTSLFGLSESLFRSQKNLKLEKSVFHVEADDLFLLSSPSGTSAHAAIMDSSTSQRVPPVVAPLEPPRIPVTDVAPGSSIRLFLASRQSLFVPFREDSSEVDV